MKNIFILFLSFLSLFAYSQKQTSVAKVPTDPLTQVQDINASNLKVTDPGDDIIYYQFNFSGDFYRVETTLYKNSILPENRIAYGVQEDEAELQNIHYPEGYIYKDFMYNPSVYAHLPVNRHILVIHAYQKTDGPVANHYTKTLTVVPGGPTQSIVPDFSIGRIQIFRDKFNVNQFTHLFFDTDNLATYPGTALNKDTKYKFVVTINSQTGSNTADPEPIFTLSQCLTKNGNYPSNILKSQNINLQLKNTTSQTIEFFETTYNSSDYDWASLAFHVDKGNLISESNENNNLKILQTQLFPKNFTIAGKVSVNVYDADGNFIKTLETTSDDTDFKNVKSKLGSGKYILRSNKSSQQVLIK